MNKKEIRNLIINHVEQYTDQVVSKQVDAWELKAYHLMSANLLKCMPHIPIEKHIFIYKKLLIYRFLENAPDFYRTFEFDTFFNNIDYDKFCRQLPAIYVTYHSGAYRTAILPMIKYNMDVAIIVDTTVFSLEKIQEELEGQIRFAREIFSHSTSQIKILSANNPNIISELFDKINNNYSILSFIDWTTEYSAKDKRSITINFFNQNIGVKQSLAMLSYITKRPIIPYISYYNKQYIPCWEISEAINPRKFSNMNSYSSSAMQQIYKYLEHTVIEYYDQWNGWWHLHKFYKDIPWLISENAIRPIEKESYKISDYSGIFLLSNAYFIINKKNFRIIRLPEKIFKILSKISDIKKDEIEDSIIHQLLNAGILQ